MLLTGSVRRPLTLWEEARTPFRVVPTDLDVLRHVNNGVYLTLMDLGRVDLMRRSGTMKLLDERGWYPVVSAQTITYRKSLTLGQRFVIATRVIGLDEKAFYLSQTFLVGETVYAHAVVQGRFLRRAGGSVPVEELVEAVGGVPEGLELPGWVQDWAENLRTVA